MTDAEPDVDVAIVGAGFAGIYMLIKARSLGLTARVIEAGPEIGGTWYWNRYPGARCDFPSVDYSYEFDDELQSTWQWTERYPAQPDILAYLHHVVDRYDLRGDIVTERRVVSARWTESGGLWTLSFTGGPTEESLTARHTVLAVGALSAPRLPDFPGLGSFEGETYSTANWPEEPVGVIGKRVAVVGTGSSGVQVIPELAREAERLLVLQRTPAFVVPARNRPRDTTEHEAFVADRAAYRARARCAFQGVYHFASAGPSARMAPREDREAIFEARWAAGGGGITGCYDDILTDRASNQLLADFLRRKIAEAVDDPEVAAALMPTDYPVGGRRIVVGSDYYETFNLPHVRLVDVRRSPVERVTERGIVVGGEEHPLDMLVFATGFDALTGAVLAIDIRGRDGLSMADAWAGGPRTYLGLQTGGFPNLFIVAGPGSPSVLSNLVRSIEQHVDWIGDLLLHMREHGLEVVEPDSAAQDAWVRHVEEVANRTLLPTVDSWYVGANVPGKPRVFMPYLGGVPAYRAICDDVAQHGYRGFAFTTALEAVPERMTRTARV